MNDCNFACKHNIPGLLMTKYSFCTFYGKLKFEFAHVILRSISFVVPIHRAEIQKRSSYNAAMNIRLSSGESPPSHWLVVTTEFGQQAQLVLTAIAKPFGAGKDNAEVFSYVTERQARRQWLQFLQQMMVAAVGVQCQADPYRIADGIPGNNIFHAQAYRCTLSFLASHMRKNMFQDKSCLLYEDNLGKTHKIGIPSPSGKLTCLFVSNIQ